MGIVSVILWSLLLIVTFKYAILIMRADNRGEGGIVALLALLDVRRATPGSWRASLLVVGLAGRRAALRRRRGYACDFGAERRGGLHIATAIGLEVEVGEKSNTSDLWRRRPAPPSF